jgi:hypothetical protein
VTRNSDAAPKRQQSVLRPFEEGKDFQQSHLSSHSTGVSRGDVEIPAIWCFSVIAKGLQRLSAPSAGWAPIASLGTPLARLYHGVVFARCGARLRATALFARPHRANR